jgi:hypothetical protein
MVQRTTFQWVPGHSPEDMSDILQQIELKFESRAIRRAESLAGRMEEWLKENAPWEDRTGDARRGLFATAIRSGEKGQGKMIMITMGYAQDTYYWIFLETMQAGRFAIVGPAIGYWGPIAIEEIYAGRF